MILFYLLLAIVAIGGVAVVIDHQLRSERTLSPFPNITVQRVRFLEDDIYEGSIPFECYENAQEDVYEIDPLDDTVEEAVRILEREGVSFAATGAGWAANPDGSYISNYATGEHTEVTAHLHNFTIKQTNQIIRRVG